MRKVRTAVVGCGAISDIYLSNMINRFDILEVVACCATHFDHAKEKAAQYYIRACTYEEILADQSIELIVNLTPACNHYDITRQALSAGKHVYTEKALTDSIKSARELVELANEKKCYLCSAPDTFLGAGLQTARKAIDDGLIGDVTSCIVSANRDNNLLLSLFPFLRMPGGGIGLDYGVYFLTALVNLLGPIAQAGAIVCAPYPKHKNILPWSSEYGQEMDTPNESQISAILQFRSGVTGTFHLNADSILDDQALMLVYGTAGILKLPSPNQFGGEVYYLRNSHDPANFPAFEALHNHFQFTGDDRGVGVAEMAYAIRSGRQARADKDLAYHVMDVIEAMRHSSESGQICPILSICERPSPLKADTDEINALM